MNKPLLLFQAPIATRSGYGDHSRDILKSIFDLDTYDVKIVPTRWGNTPQDQIDPQTEFGQFILQNIVTQLDKQWYHRWCRNNNRTTRIYTRW